MKALFILFAASLSIVSCTGTSDTNNTGTSDSLSSGTISSVAGESQTLCFQKLDGNASQDASSLRLEINGQKVSGDFAHYPYEKDSRVGTISATKDGNLIKGVWIYMQEGMTDTLDVEFKLDEDKLVQKNYTVDPKTGRQVFSEASIFNIEFEKVDCESKTL